MHIKHEEGIRQASCNITEAKNADRLLACITRDDFTLRNVSIRIGNTNEYLQCFEETKYDDEIKKMLQAFLSRYSILKRQEAKADLEHAISLERFHE
jgi:hypothetical protein